jgi:hypothetical protein
MYRDIKFVHTPGMIGLLAVMFRVFGVHRAVLHAFSLIGPLAAHGILLREMRTFSLTNRAIGSLFFLSFFYGWNGNSIWPVPLIAALAIPVARALEDDRFSRAAILIGMMILFKQTSAYLLVIVVIRVLIAGKPKRAAAIAGLAGLPYFIAAALFTLPGAGRDYFLWTLVIPFSTSGAIATPPAFGDIVKIGVCFLPLIGWTFVRESPRRGPGWLLTTTVGLTLIVVPRFDFLEAVAAVPCLALGAGRWMEQGARLPRAIRRAVSTTIGASFAATVALGGTFDGSLLFWNGEPSFERLIREIRRMPSAPLVSEIWENVLPRTGRLPPGRLYFHPWLYYDGPVEHVAERIQRAAKKENAIVVSFSPPPSEVRRSGPYWLGRAGDGRPGTDAAGLSKTP